MGQGVRKTIDSRPKRKKRKLIVLGTEGSNKTEQLYFVELEKTQDQYHFLFAKGNSTDPLGIINSVAKESKKQGLNYKNGDLSAAVFDLDLNIEKINAFEKIQEIASRKSVDLYTSNPCFEIWYLCHFEYSAKSFNSNIEVISRLKKYIPDYEKNRCVFNIVGPNSYRAIQNARQMQVSVKEVGNKNCQVNNPNTDVFLLVENVLPKSKEGGKSK